MPPAPRGSHQLSSSRWLVALRRVAAPALRLVCFPSAGGGPMLFRPWLRFLPPSLDVSAVCLPGREHRIAEPLVTDFDLVVSHVVDELSAVPGPVAFFGHSLGALLAFECARELRRRGLGQVVDVCVSSRAAPDLETPHSETLHTASDGELIQTLREMGGTVAELLDHPEWLALILPIARADLALHAAYRYRPEAPLACPVTAFGGLADRWATRDQLAGWAKHGSRFSLRMFEGDHFYLRAPGPSIPAAVADVLFQAR